MSISISVGISPRESLRDWMSFVTTLESEGVGRIWLIDSQLAMKDVYVGLATAALHTDRLELGTGVTNLLTRHPTVSANAIAAVAELSGGRAILGLGAGDSAVFGLGKSPSKVSEVEAAIGFFKAVLRGQEGEWEGHSFRLAHLASHVKVYLAVSQERMCRLGGRLADGVIIMGAAQSDILSRQVQWVTSGIEEAGRHRSDVDVGFVATMAVDDDISVAIKDVRSWATGQARLLADVTHLPESLLAHRSEFLVAKDTYDYAEHLSTHADHRSVLSDDLVRLLAIAGSSRECAGRLQELRATGVDSFIFPLMGGQRLRRLRTLRDDVLPALGP